MNKTTWHDQMRILILTLSPPHPPKLLQGKMERQAVWFRLLVAIANCGTFSKKRGPKLRAKGTSFFFSAY